MQQQSKIEWIKYGDDNTRFFFAKAKQRKLASYVYTIKDADSQYGEGFEEVGHIMLKFYKKLLGKQLSSRSSIHMEVIK